MKKIKKFIKNNKWLFITFLVSSILISVIYAIEKIAPFGNNSMLDVDFYHQYGPLLNELYDRVKSGESLLYSFNTGGGIPFYRNILNYLSSPFNVVLFLFKKENIIMAFSIIIGLKAVFASCAFSYYLKKTFKKDSVLLVVFSLFYAFSGYFCAYYWNIMWLDGIVFLPLIMHGINKIVKEEKPVFYIISLAVMLISNYFIGYMICIFSCFYFLGVFWYYGNYKFKNILKKFIMFGLSSLLAAGLVAFALLPLYYSLGSISATKDSFPELLSNFAITDYLFNHLTGVNRTVFASDVLPLPNVYPGMLTLVSIFILFFNKGINYKAKILISLTLLFFFLSFNINSIDFIWHAFHVPNDLPWRYSFIYVFVLCTIGYYSLINIKSMDKVKTIVLFALMFIFTLLSSKFKFENIDSQRVIICLIVLVLYYIIYLLGIIKKIPRFILVIFLILIASFEMGYGITRNWEINHDIDIFSEDKKTYQEMISKVKQYDNDLYRIEKTDYKTLNDGAWYDYNGITAFSSMAYENTSKFQRRFGLGGNNINSYYYKSNATPIYNTIFNIRYNMGDIIDNSYYNLMDINNNINLYRYDYPSSIAFAVNNELENLLLTDYNPFVNQSNFITSAYALNDIYTPINVVGVSNGAIINEGFFENSNGEFSYTLDESSNSITFTLNNNESQNIYLYIGGYNIESYVVDNHYYYISSDEYYINDIGIKDKGLIDVTVNIKDISSGNIYFYAYALNKEVFNKFYEKLSSEMLRVKKYNDTLIEGEISINEDKQVFTTLSYDEGFSVFVDEKKVKTKKVLDSFLAFDIKEGKHNIKIIYYPKYQKEGIIISFISLIIIGMYIVLGTKKKQK